MIPKKQMTEQQETAKDALFKSYPKTGRAFRMVQQFDDVYCCQTPEEAQVVLKELTSWMMHSRLELMKKMAKFFRTNKAEILEYFKNRLTNTFAEGMDSMI